jgi:adenylate cyclase
MAKVFLSYAREDVDSAKPLAECLGRAGHEVWWDRHIQGGSRFASEIDRELKDAEAVLVLWTEAALNSAWVQDEAAEGRDTGRLVPASLDGSRPPLGFRQFHTVELTKWNDRGEPENLKDLLSAIAKTTRQDHQTRPATKQQESSQGPAICVLPFVNMSGDPEQEYFSDGITEDIITDLSKVSALFVVARNTAFTLKGRVMNVKEVGQALARRVTGSASQPS